ncbi:hypothetical protein Tco_1265835 [Tanacetum coccineum]
MSFAFPLDLEIGSIRKFEHSFTCHASWSKNQEVISFSQTENGIRLMLKHSRSANDKHSSHPWGNFTRIRKLPGVSKCSLRFSSPLQSSFSFFPSKVLRVEANWALNKSIRRANSRNHLFEDVHRKNLSNIGLRFGLRAEFETTGVGVFGASTVLLAREGIVVLCHTPHSFQGRAPEPEVEASVFSSKQILKAIMEMEHDFKNTTINEYLEYEAEMERRLRRNVQSKRSLTKYKEADFDSFYRYEISTNVSDDVDIESMTIAEYNLYVTKQGLEKDPLNDHSYGFTPQFFAQPPHIPNTPVDKKDSSFDDILDDLFRIEAENLKRMGQEKVQNGCDDDISRSMKVVIFLTFLYFPLLMNLLVFVNRMLTTLMTWRKRRLRRKMVMMGDIYDIWDIMVEDVERITQFLSPNVPDVVDDVIQPLIPKTIHTTPTDKDYVAPATKSILDDLLEELGNEILNVTMVDEGAECNPTKDIEEFETLLAKDP